MRIRGPLAYDRVGDNGTAMAFLHALPTDRSAWLYQQAHFSTWYRTIAIDLPGYGSSPGADAGLTVDDVAAACWSAIDETTREPAILVGLSMGSTVAQVMAATRPERTLALVITGGGWFPASDARFHGNIAASIERYRNEGLAARADMIERAYGPSFRDTEMARYFTSLWVERNGIAELATIIETYRALQTRVPDDLHGRITAPTLVISGSADPAAAAHRLLAARITGAELRVMDGAGHLCNLERPWEYDALALEFLRSHRLLPSPR